MRGFAQQPSGLQPDRPNPEDIVFAELNLERWPALWATRDSVKVRVLERRIEYPDGSSLDARIRVSPHQQTGDITTETLLHYSVILKLRQEHRAGAAPEDLATGRIPFTLGKASRYLHPGKTKRQRWGSQNAAVIKRHLRKLTRTPIDFVGCFYDAKSERQRRFEGEFSILSDYFIAEERRFRRGESVQFPLELGYVRLNPFLEDNLAAHYHAPFYLSERLAIRAPFALLLYNQLDLRMTSRDRYERDLKALFEEDFPEAGLKYPAPSQRERFLRRVLEELKGRKLTSGMIEFIGIAATKNGKGMKLVVKKSPFPLRLVKPAEALGPSREPTDEELGRALLVDDILGVTCDEHSRSFYHLVAMNVPEQTIWRFLSEIRADEAGNFRGSKGMLFTTKVKDWCKQEGIAPFWKTAPDLGHSSPAA